MEPNPNLLEQALGSSPVAWAPADSSGYTRSQAWRVATREGRVFAKQADADGSLAMPRREALVYRSVTGPFLPEFVGFADIGDSALLVIELLEDGLPPSGDRNGSTSRSRF